MQDAQGNGRVRIVQAQGEEAVVAIIDHRHLASAPRAVLLANLVGIHPRMPGPDGRLGGAGEAKSEPWRVHDEA